MTRDPTTLAELPFCVVARHDKPACVGRCHAGGITDLSTRDFCDRIRDLHVALRELGLKTGDHVAIMSESRPEWSIADLAILTAGAVTVPIYPTLVAGQVAYILHDAVCKVAFVSDRTQLHKILDAASTVPSLKVVIVFESDPGLQRHPAFTGEDSAVRGFTLAELTERRKTHLHRDSSLERTHREEALKVRPDDLATIIYTSGTTGQPKGVMLTHANIISNVLSTEQVLPMFPSDVALSFLPLSHSFERTVLYKYLLCGVTVRFAESLETLPRDLLQVQPTVMTGVPRVFEKTRARIMETVAGQPALKRWLFGWAMSVGRARSRALFDKRPVPGSVAAQHALADRLVLSTLRAKLGGRLRMVVTGSAPLPVPIGEFFHAAGLNLVEGYGLTETSPVVTANPIDRIRLGTVGPPIPDVEVRIADDGEILVRGPNVMRGYYNKPDATREALRDGWFHTGDIGQLDAAGYLRITDRKKDLIVTSGGKKIAPQPIEASLTSDPLVGEAVLLGDRRNFVSALIVPSFPALDQRLRELKATSAPREELVHRPDVIAEYQKVVDRVNQQLGQFERIKKFVLLPAEFTLARGELTPTMKVRRKVVEELWAAQIEDMYANRG